MSMSDKDLQKTKEFFEEWLDSVGETVGYEGYAMNNVFELIDHYNSTKATRDLEEDAARYRVLRDSLAGRSLTWMPRVTDPLSSFYITYMPEGLDAILDKAIEFYKNQPQTTATKTEGRGNE